MEKSPYGDNVVRQGEKILDLRLAERCFHQSRDPAGRDQRVEGRNGSGQRGGGDCKRVGKHDKGAEAGKKVGYGGPPADHLQACCGAGIEEAGNEYADNGQGENPSGVFAPDAFVGDFVKRFQIDLFSEMSRYPRHVAGAYNRNDSGTWGMAYGVRKIEIPFIDQDFLQAGKFFPDGLERIFKDILLLELFNLLFGDFFVGKKRENDIRNKLHFVKETHHAPGAQQRNANLPIGKDKFGPICLRPVDCPEHLRTGGDIEFLGDLFLHRCHDELGEQGAGTFLPDDLQDVGILPFALLPYRVVAGFTEFNADGVRFFQIDRLRYQFNAVTRNVGRADKGDLPVCEFYAANVLMFQRALFSFFVAAL